MCPGGPSHDRGAVRRGRGGGGGGQERPRKWSALGPRSWTNGGRAQSSGTHVGTAPTAVRQTHKLGIVPGHLGGSPSQSATSALGPDRTPAIAHCPTPVASHSLRSTAVLWPVPPSRRGWGVAAAGPLSGQGSLVIWACMGRPHSRRYGAGGCGTGRWCRGLLTHLYFLSWGAALRKWGAALRWMGGGGSGPSSPAPGGRSAPHSVHSVIAGPCRAIPRAKGTTATPTGRNHDSTATVRKSLRYYVQDAYIYENKSDS